MPIFYYNGFLIPKPSWYDGSSYINVQLTGATRFNGEINPETVHAVPTTRWEWALVTLDGNEYISVKYTDDNPAVYNEGNLQVAIYGDEEATTERIIHRQDVTVGYHNFVIYRAGAVYFDSNIGKLRLFKTWDENTVSAMLPNGEQATITGTVSAMMIDEHDTSMKAAIVFVNTEAPLEENMYQLQFVMPIDDETDIRGWTDEQLNIGLGAVTGVKVTNTTTGEYFEFPDLMFDIFTQPITVSTEDGNLYAKVTYTSREIPILYAFSGSFFKLQPGVNILEVTATGNQEYLHGEFAASQLWAGV